MVDTLVNDFVTSANASSTAFVFDDGEPAITDVESSKRRDWDELGDSPSAAAGLDINKLVLPPVGWTAVLFAPRASPTGAMVAGEVTVGVVGAANVTSAGARLIFSNRRFPEVPRVSTRRSLMAGTVACEAVPVDVLPRMVIESAAEFKLTIGARMLVALCPPTTTNESLPGSTAAKIA